MAELAGATVALVIDRNLPEPGYSGYLRMWADASQLGIPLIMIPKIAGASLEAAVKANPALRVSIRTHAWVAEGAHEHVSSPFGFPRRQPAERPRASCAAFACSRRRPDVLVHDGWH